MNRPSSRGTQRSLLRALRFIPPPTLRHRWLMEWEGELAHRPFPGLLLTALHDALYLRMHRPDLGAKSPRSVRQPQDRPMLGPILQDIRFGLRTTRNAPFFSAVTILTLALGIGAGVAMFGVLYSVFLRPLPFPEPQELVVGRATFRGELNPWVAGADYYDYRDQSDAFQGLGAILPFSSEMTVSGSGEAQRVAAVATSPNLFPALGATPEGGRLFLPDDGLEGAEDVVLLSHGFWERRMGGDLGALGTPLVLDGSPYTVVGILPRDFFFMTPADLWIPMRPDRMSAASRGAHNWYLVGRLKARVTVEQAQAGVDVISARLQEAYPESNADKALRLTPLRDVLTEEYRLSLWILTGAVALVLLIACANGAGILLARAPARRFELSVRAALGAPRVRLVRQLLSESLILALAGGGFGTLLALWFQGVMLKYLAMERLGLGDGSLSLPTLGAALGLSVGTGLLAGVYPALKTADGGATAGLEFGGRGTGDGGSAFRSGLVTAQVAISVILLAGSGLLVRSLSNLQSLDPGFDAEDILTAGIQLPRASYPDGPSRTRFFTALQGEVSALPGVESAAITSHLPIGDFGNIWGAFAPGGEEERVRVFLRSVFPGYFETLGIPLLAGRRVDEGDDAEGARVVVLGETAARRLFPGVEPRATVGREVALSTTKGPLPMEVVGVVGDVRLSRLEEAPEAALYVPFSHRTRAAASVALKTRGDPLALAGTLRETIRRLDAEVPVTRVSPLESLVSDSISRRRVVTLSLALLAALPLLLASVGLFAILAYHVSRRRHELGVRMALGADAAVVGRMVLKQGMTLVGIGVVLGLGGAMAGTRLLRSLLFGVEAIDPLTFLAVAGLVMGVSVAACGVPVWRAARADPRVVLEAE